MSKLKVEFVDTSSSQYDDNAASIKFANGSEKPRGSLFLGDQYSMSFVQLKFRKVKSVVCCSSELFGYCKESDIEYFKFDPDDKKISSFIDCFEFIDKKLAKGNNVVVCCENGYGKSAVIIIYYLLKRNKWSLYETFENVRKSRGTIRLKPSLCKLVLQMEKELIGTLSMELDGKNLVCLKPSNLSSQSSTVPKTSSSSSGWVVLGVGVVVVSVLYGALYAVTGKL